MPKTPVPPRAARSVQLETSLTAPFEVAGFNPQFNDDATKFTVDLPTPECHKRFDQIVANLRNSGQAVDLKYDLKDEDVGMTATVTCPKFPETGPTDQNSAKEFTKFTEAARRNKKALKESFNNIYEVVETRPDSYGSPTISCTVKVNDFIAGAVVEHESYVNHKGVTVNYTRDDPHSGFVTKVEGDEFTIEGGVVLKREALYGVFRKGGSMPHPRLYHVSSENRARMTFKPRNAENGSPEEPRVPRVCLAPTPEQCIAGTAGDYVDVYDLEDLYL